MNIISNIVRFIYKIRFWIVIVPLFIGIIAIFLTKDMPKTYTVRAKIYTSVVSGINLTSDGPPSSNWNVLVNAQENLENIMLSQNVLRRVSLRLLAQHLVYGEKQHNEYISREHYQKLLEQLPETVLKLVDKSSEENTFYALLAYYDASNSNDLRSLFNSGLPHYSVRSLSRVSVNRDGMSDMINLKYENDDPGITFYTMSFLYEEFLREYDELRFGQANELISILEKELKEQGQKLGSSEKDLENYYNYNKLLDYDLQKQSAISQNETLEKKRQELLAQYNASIAAAKKLSDQISKQTDNLKNSQDFLRKLELINKITHEVAELQNSLSIDRTNVVKLNQKKQELAKEEQELKLLSNIINENKSTEAGIESSLILEQWMEETIKGEKAKAELSIINQQKSRLANQSADLGPIGIDLKQKNRSVTAEEANYLLLLDNLNKAKLRVKNMQLTSSNLKLVSAPIYPHEPSASKRKMTILFTVVLSLVLVIGYFFALELFSRKLEYPGKTENLLSQKVISVYPQYVNSEKGSFFEEKADEYLCNALMTYFKPGKRNVINLFTVDDYESVSVLGEKIQNGLSLYDFSVKILEPQKNYNEKSKDFVLVNDIFDLYEGYEDVLIVDFQNLKDAMAPENMIKNASINLLVVSANKKWSPSDQMYMENVTSRLDGAPFYIILYDVTRAVFKEFTGRI
ncbi:MAG: hypothetical protein LBV72_02495 [Tannerella sp.]|nr:hypothetical protein [Tannerella sp.]